MQFTLQVTKCTFHKFGPSGTVEKFDGLCVLPLNIINEKIYVFLWFWFILVSAVTAVQIVYRLVTLLVPSLREMMLKTRSRLASGKHVEQVRAY
jgi:membrane protein required for beta-lactamase induction